MTLIASEATALPQTLAGFKGVYFYGEVIIIIISIIFV